jgi:hypothetical protein
MCLELIIALILIILIVFVIALLLKTHFMCLIDIFLVKGHQESIDLFNTLLLGM